jgi:hypothetical protein
MKRMPPYLHVRPSPAPVPRKALALARHAGQCEATIMVAALKLPDFLSVDWLLAWDAPA